MQFSPLNALTTVSGYSTIGCLHTLQPMNRVGRQCVVICTVFYLYTLYFCI
jgi:hypothetical protein